MNGEIDYDRIRARVEKRMKKRRKFMSNLGGYTTAIAIVWAIWFFTGMGWPWPLIPSAIIAIVAAREFLDSFFFSEAMDNAYDRAMEREIARERARLGISGNDDVAFDYEKPKRGEKAKRGESAVRLSDDGELVPLDEEDEAAETEQRADYHTRHMP